MIQQELTIINNIQYTHTYSDKGFQILKRGTNEIYDDAYDQFPYMYTYDETNIPIVQEEEEEESDVDGQ